MPDPAVINGLTDCGRKVVELTDVVDRVRALHVGRGSHTFPTCRECGKDWPCPTLAALDGETP